MPWLTGCTGGCPARSGAATVLGCLPAGPAWLTAGFTGLRFVDRERTACELSAVELLDGGFGRLALGHLDKPKAFGAPGVPVGNHIDRVHHSIRLKELAQVMIRRTKRKVPYKDIHAKVLFMVENRKQSPGHPKQYAGAQGQSTMQEKRRREPRRHT